MSDAELLDKAAKAAGGYYDELAGCFSTDMVNWEQWEPLEDDGDAFRLAVSLDIAVLTHFPSASVASFDQGPRFIEERQPNNPMPATRRAIVRAAAAMADRME